VRIRFMLFLLLATITLQSCSPLLLVGIPTAAVMNMGDRSSKDGPLKRIKVDRSSPNFASDLRKITSAVESKPVDVVIAGVPPTGDGSVIGVSQADTSVDIDLRETTYRKVFITQLTPEILEIRSSDQQSGKLVIPNFQVKQIALQEVNEYVDRNTTSKVGYGLLIIFCLIIAGVLLLGDFSGSGMPPLGCTVTGGVIALLFAAVGVFFLESASDPENQQIIQEFVNRVWKFM